VLGFWLTIVSLFVLVPAAVMVVLGVRMTRRSSAVPRVPIEVALGAGFENSTTRSDYSNAQYLSNGLWKDWNEC
jgi:hypothetical protein